MLAEAGHKVHSTFLFEPGFEWAAAGSRGGGGPGGGGGGGPGGGGGASEEEEEEALITHRTSSDTKRPCVFTKPCELVTERSRSHVTDIRVMRREAHCIEKLGMLAYLQSKSSIES
jgi:hypothetical protein